MGMNDNSTKYDTLFAGDSHLELAPSAAPGFSIKARKGGSIPF